MNVVTRANAEAAPWIERAARVGFIAIGVVYVVIGLLAIRAAFGEGSTTNQHGALIVLLQQPFGRIILWIVAIGLFGFSLWRILDAIRDLSGHGSDAKGKSIRAGMAVRAIVYLGFGIEAARIATRGWASGGGSGQKTQHWTARILELPYGRWLVAAIGLGVIGYGLYQIVLAFRRKVAERLRIGSLAPSTRRRILLISRAGIAARGVVFGIIGYFLVLAGLRSDPREARDIGGALGSVMGGEHGTLMLIIIGVGLIAFAIYQFASSVYRPVQV